MPVLSSRIFIACLAFLAATAAAADDIETPLPPKTSSGFSLAVNEDPDICRAWLDSTNRWLRTSRQTVPTAPDVSARLPAPAEALALQPVEHSPPPTRRHIAWQVTRSPDGALPNGQVLFQLEYSFNWQGNNYALFLVDDRQTAEELTDALKASDTSAQASALFHNQPHIHKLLLSTNWLPAVAWVREGKILFANAVTEATWYLALFQARYSEELLMVSEDGKAHKLCGLKHPFGFTTSNAQKLADTAMAELRPYLGLIDKMAGVTYSAHCGTLQTGVGRQEKAEELVPYLTARPWALSTPANTTTQAEINIWGASGIWANQIAQNFQAERIHASAFLTAWYQQAFGYPPDQAANLADRALDTHLSTAIQLQFSFDDIDKEIEKLAGPSLTMEVGRAAYRYFLTAAIVRGHPLETVGQLARHSLDASREWASKYYAISHLGQGDPLPQAVKRPDVVALMLRLGFNPDRPNPFGKTPLMYAAQYDQPESARLLLGAGADPNARSKKLTTCGIWVEKERTALDYARENGASDIVALLNAQAPGDKTE